MFLHFSLDFSIYDADSGHKVFHFPYHPSFKRIREMLKHWMDEAKGGEYFFSFDNRKLHVYRHGGNIYFSDRQKETEGPGDREWNDSTI